MKTSADEKSVAWLIARRGWLLMLAVAIGAVLRNFGPPRKHVVPADLVWVVALTVWTAAHVATLFACGGDALAGASARAWGTGALAVLSLAGLGVTASTFWPFSPEFLVALACSSGLLALFGLCSDAEGRRAKVVLLALLLLFVGERLFVPRFQGGPTEAHRAKAMQDLDTIRNAITLHDAQNPPLRGTSFQPLLGRYLQDVIKDPWGFDYLLDADVGLVTSFGADQKAGGADEDEDLTVRYKAALRIRRATLRGPAGPPAEGTAIELVFNKPFVLQGDPRADVCVIVDARHGGRGLCLDGAAATPGLSWGQARWEVFQGERGTDPQAGVLVFRCRTGDPDCPIHFSRSTSVNIGAAYRPGSVGEVAAATLRESITLQGPLDPAVYGTDVIRPGPALGLELIGGENRGVPLEPAPREAIR